MESLEDEYAIGLDLGTTFSCIGVYRNDWVEIIPNRIGEKITPSVVIITKDAKVLVGEQTDEFLVKNYDSCIYEVKRLIGRSIDEEERKKLEEKSINEGGEEEMVSGLGDSINIMGGNDVEEQEEAQKIEEGPDIVTEEEVSEETEEEKRFNDVNYWKADVKPDDNIMSAVLNDLD